MILIAMFAASMMLAETTPAAATAASAVPTTAPTVTPATVVKKADEKPHLTCTSERVIGTLMPKRTCYTSEQYAQRQKDGREELENIQSQHPMGPKNN